MQVAKTKTKKHKSVGLKQELRKETFWCYLMLALPIIGFCVFTVYPIIYCARWSFYTYSGIKSQAVFVGLRNYISIMTTDLTYWKTWLTTIEFALLKVPVELSLALMLALVLKKGMKGAGFFRAVYYMPNVISVAIIGVIMSNLFGYFGIVNYALEKIGVIADGYDWFASKGSALVVLALGSVWNTMGVNVMYFISALANIPDDVYESAAIDGASGAQVFFKITLPLLMTVGRVVLLLSINGTLHVAEYILTVCNAAPAGATNTVMSYMMKQFTPGFAESANPPIGYGCAMGFINTFIYSAIGIGYNKLSAKFDQVA